MFFSWGEGGGGTNSLENNLPHPTKPDTTTFTSTPGVFFVLCLEGMGFWNQSKSSINLMEVMWFTGALLLSSDSTRME